MLKNDSRIELWRNTIQLFHKYNRPPFVGPFKATGLKYIVERLFLTSEYEEKKPDIVSSGETGWMILELTTRSKSKKPKLDKYRTIDSNYLSTYGLHIHKREPDVLSSRLSYVDDGPYCQIIVKDVLQLKKEENIQNQNLKDNLIEANGKELKKLPQIPFTLVPEMSLPEVRQGLVDIVLNLFEQNNPGKTLGEIVDEGLERLANKISVTEKRSLMDKVKSQLDVLIRKHLNGYLEFKENHYRTTGKFKQHHKTMGHISSKLREWTGEGIDKTLDNFTQKKS
ncbi:MAG: hypothetical protein V3U20_04815 [Thermoplasmata archaeon]